MRRLPVLLVLALLPAACGLSCRQDAANALLSGPYVIALTTDSATVCWQTRGEASGAVRVKAELAEAWNEVAEPVPVQFHAVTLSGLAADTEHAVEVLADGATLAGLAFRTAPAAEDHFTFYAYGDTRSNPGLHARVVAALMAEADRLRQFTFVLHTGDFAEKGSGAEATADEFFRPAAPMLARLPLIPVRGNHENLTDLFKKYFPAPERPAGPDGPDDMCFDYGSVRLVVLDKYAPREAGEARMKWLAARLAEARDRWRLVSFHEPIYCSGLHGPATTSRALMEPVLVAGKVHAVLGGHDHNYERTKVIKGITHFTLGGGGAPLRGKHAYADRWDWAVRFESVLHFATVTVTPEKLTVKAFGPRDGGEEFQLFDSVDIPWDCGWPEVN